MRYRVLVFLLVLTLLNLSISFGQNNSVLISNFHVRGGEPARIYFDSSEPIAGSDATGFIVSDNNVSGISISSGNRTGHYLTVSRPFTFWDNNTLRYEGGSNLRK